MACALVQPVDVLRHERVQFAAPLELDERAMTGVRPRVPCRMLDSALPRELPHLGIRHVVMDVGKLLGLRVLRPYTLRSAKIGNAGIGGDSRTGEDDDPRRLVYPAAGVRHGVVGVREDTHAACESYRAAYNPHSHSYP